MKVKVLKNLDQGEKHPETKKSIVHAPGTILEIEESAARRLIVQGVVKEHGKKVVHKDGDPGEAAEGSALEGLSDDEDEEEAPLAAKAPEIEPEAEAPASGGKKARRR